MFNAVEYIAEVGSAGEWSDLVLGEHSGIFFSCQRRRIGGFIASRYDFERHIHIFIGFFFACLHISLFFHFQFPWGG